MDNIAIVENAIYLFSLEVWEDTAINPIVKNINSIIDYMKLENKGINDGFVLNDIFVKDAGKSILVDWKAISLGLFGYKDNNSKYLEEVNKYVTNKYDTTDKLNEITEWHRISLAILAMGGDPTKAGVDGSIDLIADGTYDFLKATGKGLMKQGVNGAIWALITLDSKNYIVPENADYTRDDMIEMILKTQKTDGGFSFFGNETDPDISGMTLCALSSYYDSEKKYTYELNGETVTKTVKQVVDECVDILSNIQLEGGFASWGTVNCSSTAYAIIGLSSVGVDFMNDSRFIKNDNNLIEALMSFKNTDGGYKHTLSLPNSFMMSTDQALLAFVAIYKAQNNLGRLFSF